MKAAVLDSYALISYLDREQGYEAVAELFEECVAKDREMYLCVVNWGEVMYHAMRVGGDKGAQLAEDSIRALPIEIVDANRDLTLQAARLKAVNKMSYADCYAAALAMKRKCDLVTGDREFKEVENQLSIRWIK